MNDQQLLVVIAFLAMVVLLLVFFFGLMLPLFRCWIQVVLAGGRGSLFRIVGMRLRGSPVRRIVDAYVMLRQQAEPISLQEVEQVYLDHRHTIRTAHELQNQVLEERRQAEEAAR